MDVLVSQEPIHSLEKFKNVVWMKTVWERNLKVLGLAQCRVRDCQLSYVNYKRYLKPTSRHKSYMAVCYELGLTGPDGKRLPPQIIYGKAFVGNRSMLEYKKIKNLVTADDTWSLPPMHLTDLDMVAWVFPADPALPHLPEVAVGSRVVQHLPMEDLLSEYPGKRRLLNVKPQVIHYRPECRCTIRYELQWQCGDQIHTSFMFGKMFKEGGREIFQRMVRLWELSQKNPNGLHIAKPLKYEEALQTAWQVGVTGQPLRHVIHGKNYQDCLDSVARGLVAIQESDIETDRSVTSDDHLIEVDKKIEKLSQVFPAGHTTFQELIEKLRSNVPSDRTLRRQLIHGDFHINQLIADQRTITFFDFDEFAHGDPMQDVANFIVDLHFQEFSPVFVHRMARALFHSYCRYAPWEVSRRRIEWHAAIQFANKVYRSYIQRKPNFQQEYQYLVQFLRRGMEFEF